jgi:hypothetical protein
MGSSTVPSAGDSIRRSGRSTLRSFSTGIIITTSILTHAAGVKAGTTMRAFVEADIMPGMDTQDRTLEAPAV